MDREKMIDGWGKELARVRSQMDELGPIAVGTLGRSTKKYRTKDGAEHTCSDSAVLKFAGAGKNLTVRVPGDKENAVRKLLENGRKWRSRGFREEKLLCLRQAAGTELTAKGLGFPQYANDDVVIPALQRWGYELEDARDYSVAACWEFLIPGCGMDINNIDAVSFVGCLDAALRNLVASGRGGNGDVPNSASPPTTWPVLGGRRAAEVLLKST